MTQFENKLDYLSRDETRQGSASATFIAKAFGWMAVALAISAVTAYAFAVTPELLTLLYKPDGTGLAILGWVVIFAPFILVLVMSAGINKLSPIAMTLLFVGFSILMGASLSSIFLIYDIGAIYKTFAVTTLMFGTMAIVGYTTKTDLTKFGSLMMMALFGMIIAMVINFFTKSPMMDYIISFVGVVVFTGLTAYDTQKLKNMGASMDTSSSFAKKATILGALTLYLDFVNLFLFLLRLFGNKR